jgi:hypothetical protein
LNWITGETVAVKQIRLGNIPASELGEIMVSRVETWWCSGKERSLMALAVRDRSAAMPERECTGLASAGRRAHPLRQHPNIVKYKGSEKTRDYLYIILE